MPRAFRLGRHRKNEIRRQRAQAGGVPLTMADEPVPLPPTCIIPRSPCIYHRSIETERGGYTETSSRWVQYLAICSPG